MQFKTNIDHYTKQLGKCDEEIKAATTSLAGEQEELAVSFDFLRR